MDLIEVARPGIMLSQTWPKSRESEGATLEVFEQSVATGLFDSYQSVEVPFPRERKAIADLVISQSFKYTYCVARVLNENNLNLASLDSSIKKRTYSEMLVQIDHAKEAGASALSFVSGPAPKTESDRKVALKCLGEMLARLSEKARVHPKIDLVIEPLDVTAHKKMVLGYTSEAIELCKNVAAAGGELFLCLDTAHLLLNDEQPVSALESAGHQTKEFHFCNCVTDLNHPEFGDRHIMFGSPGEVGIKEIAQIMKAQLQMGYFNSESRPVVMCEVLRRDGDDPLRLAHYCGNLMKAAWALSQENN